SRVSHGVMKEASFLRVPNDSGDDSGVRVLVPPAERLVEAAPQARNEIVALVAKGETLVDARNAFVARSREIDDLARALESLGARRHELERVAVFPDLERPA